MSGTVIIHKGREKPIRQRHPWIFSGAIERVEGSPTPGDIVTVTDQGGRFLGRGYWNPRSQIQVRLLTWEDENITDEWWRRALHRAVEGRNHLLRFSTEGKMPALRLVNAENDYVPGLIADLYGNWLVVQALTLGIEQHKAMIAEALREILAATRVEISGIYERSDVDVRGKEGLSDAIGPLWGQEPPELIEIHEAGPDGAIRCLVDVRRGHKTGFYLDQRPNRRALRSLIAERMGGAPARMLNLFSYSGSFGLAGPAQTVHVDASYDALELAERTYQLNGQPADSAEFIQADVFDYLRDQVTGGEQYHVVVLDPPKFAHSAQQVEKAARGYKDINLNAFRCVKPGGYMMTFSCSGAVSADLFQKIVFGALADSGRQAQILSHLGAGDDHPVALTFPEGAYLKGLLLRVY